MRTLSIDIGGSHIKAAVLDERARVIGGEQRVATPNDVNPERLMDLIADVAAKVSAFDRVSAGFPGVVRGGVVLTAYNLGSERFSGFRLAESLEKRLGKPARVCNDADVQGYGAIGGHGVEMVITLGTGFGSSLFSNGRLAPHLELAHHCFRGGRTYEEELGDEALAMAGVEEWNSRLAAAVETLRSLTHFDRLYIGGGNSRLVNLVLPDDVVVVSNVAGLLGGIRLWDDPPGG
jgi:polyphosphate glucokinase